MSTVDGGRRETPSRRVLERVAAHRGVDPADLEPPLFEVVDPDALDALFGDGAHGTGHVAFRYADLTVVVHHDGRVLLEE